MSLKLYFLVEIDLNFESNQLILFFQSSTRTCSKFLIFLLNLYYNIEKYLSEPL
jgi:hypothetical protein